MTYGVQISFLRKRFNLSVSCGRSELWFRCYIAYFSKKMHSVSENKPAPALFACILCVFALRNDPEDVPTQQLRAGSPSAAD